MRLSALPRSSNNCTPSPSTVCLWSNGKAQIPLGSNKEQLIIVNHIKRKKTAIKRRKKYFSFHLRIWMKAGEKQK